LNIRSRLAVSFPFACVDGHGREAPEVRKALRPVVGSANQSGITKIAIHGSPVEDDKEKLVAELSLN
jgi:hypothetical protein